MKLENIKNALIKQKPYLKKKYGVSSIGLFGSHVRGDQTKYSDIDILVDIKRNSTLFDLMDIEFYLEDLLGKNVDLVPKDSLRKHVGKYILKEVQYL